MQLELEQTLVQWLLAAKVIAYKLFARLQKLAETIRVHAEVEKNIRNVVANNLTGV